MAVNLSPIGGVAGQFFTNNGTPLSGGKIFTYAAGTTTPQVTYTSASGSIAHTNPIILDSAGRVPSGEIWLTDGLAYKFTIKDSNDVLIGTYDNVVGINSNFVNFTNEQEIQTATAGQTVFNLTTMQYQPGTNSLSVFVDGVNQYGPGASFAYVETDSDTVTFTTGLHVGAEVKFTTSNLNSSAGSDAFNISYVPPFTSSVATNVGDKLAQTVSVKDFGAVGDGLTDDTDAIRNAATAANTAGVPLNVDRGVYFINSPADIELRVNLNAPGAVFKLGASMGATSVFIARGNPLEDITANVVLPEIVKNVTTVASLAAYRNGFIRIHSNVPNLTRTPGSAMLFKGECGYLTKGGVLVTPIRHDYTTGGTGVTKVEYRRDETQQLVVFGGAVDINGKVGARFLTVERNDVKVKNWSVFDSTESAKIETALLFRVFNNANFVMEDISGDAMNQAVSAAFSYLVEISYSFNCQFSRCFVHGGWGAFTANGVNGYHIHDSNFDRFDIHYDGYDMTVDNCTFYQSVQYGSGGGVLRVTNSTKIAKQVTPFLSNTSVVPVVVGARSDYGGTWDGNVYIAGVTVVVSASFTISTTNYIRFFNAGANGDFGAGRALPDPHTIVLRDCLVDAPAATLSNNSFGVRGVRLDGARNVAGAPGTIPPFRIVVDNLAVSNPEARGLGTAPLTDLSVDAAYASSIVPGQATPRVVRAFGTMDSVRGQDAVDLQPVATARTRIASGNFATIGGGDSNQANGDYSWVPGGTNATTRGRTGSWAWASNPANLGRYQLSGIMLQARTTDATPTRLVSGVPGAAATVANQLSFPANSGSTFIATVVARSSGAVLKGWKVEGVTRNTGGAFSLISPAAITVIAEQAGAVSWSLTVTADNTLDALDFTVTGAVATTIDWAARVEVVEIGL